MFRNRTFKILSSLILLMIFCSGKVSAAPAGNNFFQNTLPDMPKHTIIPTRTPTTVATGIYDNSTLSGTVSCGSEYTDSTHPQTCTVTGSCIWDNMVKKLSCVGTWKAEDTYGLKTQYIHPYVILKGTNMSSGMSVWWRNSIYSNGNFNVFNYCVDGTGDFGRTGSRLWENGSLCFRQSTANTPAPWLGELSGVFAFEFGLYPPEVELDGIEVTQVVQNLNNSVPLIADKPTYVRAYLRTKHFGTTVKNTTVELAAYRNDVLLGTAKPSNLAGGYIDVTYHDLPIDETFRGDLESSFYFKIPQAWITAGDVTFKINEVNQPITCAEQDTTPNDCQAKVSFINGPVPHINFYGVSFTGHVPNRSHYDEARNQILKTFPISKISGDYYGNVTITNLPSQPTNEEEVKEVWARMLELNLYLNSSDCIFSECFTVGILTDYPYNYNPPSGWGALGTAVSYLADSRLGNFVPINFGHEVGHVSGLLHVNCNGDEVGTNPFYPYLPGGKISAEFTGPNALYGLDTTLVPQSLNYVLPKYHDGSDMKVVYKPSETGDMMSYCPIVWPSDWTYNFIRTALTLRWPLTTLRAAAPLSLQSSVIITGLIDNTQGTGNLRSVYTLESNPTIPTSGSYVIRFEDTTNQILASYNFEPETVGEASDFGAFALTLPWDSNTARIVVLDPSGAQLDSRTVSNHAPTVTVISPNGGESLSGSSATISWSASDADNDPLKYIIEYSNDGGGTWHPLAVDYPNTTYDLDLASIPGGDTSLIRVIANDGILTSEDQSDAVFSVGKHAPEATIDTQNNATFSGDQTITLEGSGYDLEDGDLAGSTLTWSSDLDGVLGQGASISVNAQNMSEGAHTITLTVTDSDGQTGTALITIRVYRLYSSLSVEPTSIHLTAEHGSTQVLGQFVSIDHLGNHSLTWSASADKSWIVLSSTTGITPTDLYITANLASLPVGTHNGTVTITSNAEINSSQIIPVTLEVMPPDTQINSGPSNLSNSGSAAFTFSSGDSAATFECSLDGAGYISCASPKSYTNLVEGSHTFNVRANSDGNVDPSPASYTWIVDTTAPNTTITAKPINPTASKSASFSFTGMDNHSGSGVSSFQCKLDGSSYTPCTNPKSYANLIFGSHTFYVRALDKAGNIESTPASYTWLVWGERLLNGGFNNYPTTISKIPTSWIAVNFSTTDGKDIATANKKEGIASVKIANAAAVTKTITQTFTLSGVMGNSFKLSYWIKGNAVPTTAGVCQAQVVFYNGTILKGTKTLPCGLTGTFAYTQKNLSFTAPAAYTSIKVVFTYSKATGAVWFDLASLLR